MEQQSENPFIRTEKMVRRGVREMTKALLSFLDTIDQIKDEDAKKEQYSSLEAMMATWDEMDKKYGREESVLIRKSMDEVKRLKGMTGFVRGLFAEEDLQRTLEKNGRPIAHDQLKLPFLGNLYGFRKFLSWGCFRKVTCMRFSNI